jgi:hypothetical protein
MRAALALPAAGGGPVRPADAAFALQACGVIRASLSGLRTA